MRKVFITFLVCLMCALSAKAIEYPVYIKGIQVTSTNALDVLGDGTVTFDEETFTLTLNNANINTGSVEAQGMTVGINGMTVKLIGTNQVTSNSYSGIKVTANATITGTGTLKATGADCGIMFDNPSYTSVRLSVTDGAQVYAKGAKGISGDTDYSSTLFISGYETVIHAFGTEFSMGNLQFITLRNNQQIVSPEGAVFNNKFVRNANGDIVAGQEVVIMSPLLRGDVDISGSVNIGDVAELTDYLLTGYSTHIRLKNADVDDSGSVNIADVTELIDYLLYGVWNVTIHEYVDLGLPSGTLWATCNVGASSPEEYGDYFAWGETEPKEVYNWNTYKWCNGSQNTLTKYCNHSNNGYNGFTDGKTEFDPEDDAAFVNWGTSWRTPTYDQLLELYRNCTWTWTQLNGVNGELVTGPNGNSIFLPAAGGRYETSLGSAGSGGYYWLRTLYSGYSYSAYDLSFISGNVTLGTTVKRYYGCSVRAVRVS